MSWGSSTGSVASGGWGAAGSGSAASSWGGGSAATSSWEATADSWANAASEWGDSISSWGESGAWGNSSASSWANAQAKGPEEYGRSGAQTQGSIAGEIFQAGAQAYEAYVDHMREQEDVSVTTDRMKKLCVETDQIANHSVAGLKEQNEKLERLQDEMADIHDDLNTSEKKMTQVKSFWGGFATIGSSKTHDQHHKMRVKEERNRDKMLEQRQAEQEKWQGKDDKLVAKQNKQAISQHVHDHKKAVHQAKKENMAEAKAITKGRAEAVEEKQVWGGHVFETRIDGCGPKHQAEQDLDDVADYIHGFHEKAELMSKLVDESKMRTARVNSELDRANSRTRVLNKQADRYCGKK